MRLGTFSYFFSSIFLVFQVTQVKSSGHQEKLIFASVNFPQLYTCKATSISSADEKFIGQIREDEWLWDKVFSKLPLDEVLGGTFVEIGALNGMDGSNTLFFEKKLDFRGLLIEGHPVNQAKLKANAHLRKNSAIFTTGICNYENHLPGTLSFTKGGGAVGAALAQSNPSFLRSWHGNNKENYDVRCIPMQSIFDHSGMLDIDLFSLDVEGAELHVLKTIDFKVTNIRVIVVELDHHDLEKNQKVRDLLASHGFENTLATLGNMAEYCLDKRENFKYCINNEAFLNPKFKERKAARAATIHFPRYFHKDTALACEKQYGYGLKATA